MNEVIFLSMIQVCIQLGCIKKGKWVYYKIIIYGIKNDMYIDIVLIDMYVKFGDIKMVKRVFDSMKQCSVVFWSIMIVGYGVYGCIDVVIKLFN